ncbi:MAG: SDR family NAD(P)-dependent oxidoreductase [Glaciecola sp.]
MKTFNNKHILITGAASGIGRALAIAFSQYTCTLYITDANNDGLQETAQLCRSNHATYHPNTTLNVHTYCFKVNQQQEWENTVKQVLTHTSHLDIVINNAGIAHQTVTAESVNDALLRNIMDVNFYGMVYGTQACLPLLKNSPEGCLANVSSLFGLVGIAYQSAYCASKFAIRGYTESLRMEAQAFYPHVNILTIHPGGVRTDIANTAVPTHFKSPQELEKDIKKFNKALVLSPSRAAQQVLRGITKQKTRVLVGSDAKLFDFIARIMPQRYTRLGLYYLKKMNLID